MNWEMAKEVGIVTYLWKRVAWRIIQLTGNGVTMFPLPSGSVIRLPHSSPFASDIYCTGGRVDWGSEELLATYLKSQPKGVCYDVGANMGYYSVLLSPLASEVVAFEPDPRNHEALLAQKIPNLSLVAKAVAEHPGTVEFDVSDASTVGHIRLEHQEGQSIKVEAVSLDEYSRSRESSEVVRAVKMDVEGFEILGLKGSAVFTQKNKPVYLIEFGLDEGVPNNAADLATFLQQHDYVIYTMVRTAASGLHFHTLLKKISPNEIQGLNFKMLFLVPSQDTFFASKAAEGYSFP
jgi:FkbM family methyltransferase